jgi:hypothetical protein
MHRCAILSQCRFRFSLMLKEFNDRKLQQSESKKDLFTKKEKGKATH